MKSKMDKYILSLGKPGNPLIEPSSAVKLSHSSDDENYTANLSTISSNEDFLQGCYNEENSEFNIDVDISKEKFSSIQVLTYMCISIVLLALSCCFFLYISKWVGTDIVSTILNWCNKF